MKASLSKPENGKHETRSKASLIAWVNHFAALPAKPKGWLCIPVWVAQPYSGGHPNAAGCAVLAQAVHRSPVPARLEFPH